MIRKTRLEKIQLEMVEPGEAVNKLIRLRKKSSRSAKGKGRERVSQRVKDFLYPA